MKPTTTAQQTARAESALSTMLSRFPHVDSAPVPVKVLPELLAQRLDGYLDDAVHPRNAITAMELIASAKELLYVAFTLDALGSEEYRKRHTEILSAQLKVMMAQEERAKAARLHKPFDDGVRPAVAEDGAYRFNPLTGQHE